MKPQSIYSLIKEEGRPLDAEEIQTLIDEPTLLDDIKDALYELFIWGRVVRSPSDPNKYGLRKFLKKGLPYALVSKDVDTEHPLVVQLALQLKPRLSMAFDEKHTIEDLREVVMEAVNAIPPEFK